jgi:hypothetical protein
VITDNFINSLAKDTHSGTELVCAFVTGGLSLVFGGCTKPTYAVRFADGTEKEITAKDADELGEKISRGEFD